MDYSKLYLQKPNDMIDLLSNFIDRYNRLHGPSWGGKYSASQNARNAYDVARKELFRD